MKLYELEREIIYARANGQKFRLWVLKMKYKREIKKEGRQWKKH